MQILFKAIKISQGYVRPGKWSPRNIDLIIYPTTSLAKGSIISQDTSLRVVPVVHERGIVQRCQEGWRDRSSERVCNFPGATQQIAQSHSSDTVCAPALPPSGGPWSSSVMSFRPPGTQAGCSGRTPEVKFRTPSSNCSFLSCLSPGVLDTWVWRWKQGLGML